MLPHHPRSILALGFVVLCALLYYASSGFTALPTTMQSDTSPHNYYIFHSPDLKDKLERSESIYQDLLTQRKQLIKKHGPTPDKISMFPPDVKPWPPYTGWDYFPAAYNCPHEVERLGALGDGGKWVCGISQLARKPDCVIYSFGINYESSFEAKLLSRTQACQVWGYDFSVKSFGPEIPHSDADRAHFFAFGLAGSDAHEPHHEKKMYKLSSLMEKNGHSFIDILKIDIESWEFEALTSFIHEYRSRGQPLPIGQLQLEIHAWNKRFDEFLKWWESLEEAGLRPFWTEPNLVYQNYNRGGSADLAEYSFINIFGNHSLISD